MPDEDSNGDEGGPGAAVAERLLDAAVAALDLYAVALGDRLGYYRHLAAHGPLDPSQLAAGTGTSERYAREWLEHQAVTGLLLAAEEGAQGADGPGRTFRLAPGAAQVLADPDDPSHLAPLARQIAAAVRRLPDVAAAVRSGGGVPWADFGADMRESEGDLNKPAYLHSLVQEWLPAIPDVHRRLGQDPPARVAEVGCGAGWASIALARGHPAVTVDAFDVDAASVQLAQRNVIEAGLGERVRVHEADVAQLDADAAGGPYDVVLAFECVHDLPRPVEALSAMRRMAGADGTVLVADMRVADSFTAPGDLVERLMYGFSLSICLPDGMSTPGSAATGTVMRRGTLESYARRAGFADVEVLPVEHEMWRFYRLHPAPAPT